MSFVNINLIIFAIMIKLMLFCVLRVCRDRESTKRQEAHYCVPERCATSWINTESTALILVRGMTKKSFLESPALRACGSDSQVSVVRDQQRKCQNNKGYAFAYPLLFWTCSTKMQLNKMKICKANQPLLLHYYLLPIT